MQLDRRITRGISVSAFGILALAATEVLPVTPVQAVVASHERTSVDHSRTINFGLISEKAMNVSREVWLCITKLSVKAFSGETGPTEITNRRIVVFNTSNPNGAVTLEVTSNQAYKGTGKGKDTYEVNTKNPTTNENYAIVKGNPSDKLCQTTDPDCRKTQIGGYEETPDGQRRNLPLLPVDCPPEELCEAWGNVPIELSLYTPTPTATLEPTSTATKTPAYPTRGLPRTGN